MYPITDIKQFYFEFIKDISNFILFTLSNSTLKIAKNNDDI